MGSPALGGTRLLAIPARSPRWSLGLARVGVISAVLLLHVPFVDYVFQFAQPRPGNPDSRTLPLAGPAVALATLSIAHLHSAVRRP